MQLLGIGIYSIAEAHAVHKHMYIILQSTSVYQDSMHRHVCIIILHEQGRYWM